LTYQSDTAISAIPPGYVLVKRKAVDNAIAAAFVLNHLQEQYPEIVNLKDLYKEGFMIAMKMDSVQENRSATAEKIILITDENYKAMKKRLLKNKLSDIWNRAKVPISFVAGVILGSKITADIVR
jgi:hypothetical protein